jgi:hypothetical protein
LVDPDLDAQVVEATAVTVLGVFSMHLAKIYKCSRCGAKRRMCCAALLQLNCTASTSRDPATIITMIITMEVVNLLGDIEKENTYPQTILPMLSPFWASTGAGRKGAGDQRKGAQGSYVRGPRNRHCLQMLNRGPSCSVPRMRVSSTLFCMSFACCHTPRMPHTHLQKLAKLAKLAKACSLAKLAQACQACTSLHWANKQTTYLIDCQHPLSTLRLPPRPTHDGF